MAKTKAFLSAFLIALMISGLAFVGSAHFGSAQSGTSGTNVSGIITSDATWTQANSPYTLTGNVLVNNGVMLTIDAGATVNLGNYYIMVNGTLVAIGNSNSPISFNGGQITFTQYSNGWNDSVSAGCVIENAVLTSTLTLSNSAKIDNDTIYSSITVQAAIGTPISNNIIEGGINFNSGANANISNNTIMNKGVSIGPWLDENITISGNTISGAYAGISCTTGADISVLIEGNLIIKNTNGIYLSSEGGPLNIIIQNNTFTINTVGINIQNPDGTPLNQAVLYNNIYGNTNYNINNQEANALNATFNWWGTTDTQAISQTIYDYYDDFNLGIVTFVPFLTAPNPEAMPSSTQLITNIATTSNSTSTQSSSLSPTTASTSSPTSTMDPSASPSTSQSQRSTASLPTELIVAAMVIVIIVVAIGAFLLGKRTGRNSRR
jgi:hypothetical protein